MGGVEKTLTLRAAGATDVGRQRDVNEDRFHIDRDRGVFMVVDGVGGQAAGGRAADTALEMVRARLASGTGTMADRIRDAITIANNEVHRQAAARAEWRGMACVLTVAVIDGDRAIIGHVGDTRLYKLRAGAMHKITSDHSPIGEREDAGEISESDAMRHPRRNEVYRDVGSELHEVGDSDFVEVREAAWEPDAALLLCSDGLTDLVSSDTIQRVVTRLAGQPAQVARALVKAANDAGGKDNITVVYVEGDRFAPDASGARRRSGRGLLHAAVWILAAAALAFAWRSAGYPLPAGVASALGVSAGPVLVVGAGESIGAALARAAPGTTVLVEPGEYRERLTLKDDVRVVSRVPRGAILRLPGTATEEDAAVMALGVANAELVGFRIVGDAATPLGTGILTRSSTVRLLDLDVSGAARTAIDLGAGSDVLLLGSAIHDNPGAGLALRANATMRLAHNAFLRNGSSEQAMSAIVIEPGARPTFQRNVFQGVDPHAFALADEASRLQLKTENWFPDAPPAIGGPARGRGRGQ
jgi:serine/threonine protein phosphatase PrpC